MAATCFTAVTALPVRQWSQPSQPRRAAPAARHGARSRVGFHPGAGAPMEAPVCAVRPVVLLHLADLPILLVRTGRGTCSGLLRKPGSAPPNKCHSLDTHFGEGVAGQPGGAAGSNNKAERGRN